MAHRIKELGELESAFEKGREQIQRDYFQFLTFQSVSSEPAFQEHVLECFDWLREYVTALGFTTERWETSAHPVLFAQKGNDPKKPTVLIYNHYDVQPVDPLEQWKSPPFEPTLRDGEVYARGAQDNKGQCFYVISAIKALLESGRELPVNLKLCIEGEEEIGSPGISQLLGAKADKLRADHLLVVDLGMHRPDAPAVTLGIRGMVTMTVELTGSSSDLHSGSHGGMVVNPNHALVALLASLRDRNGMVTVPGFYDQVVTPSADEKAKINFAFDEKDYNQKFGAEPLGGERGLPPLERAWLRPTLEINGIGGGYTGAGFKTVIPAKSIAKISCRLVPNQDPNEIGTMVAQFLKANVAPGIKIQVDIHPGVGRSVRTGSDSTVIRAVSQAYSEVLSAPCEYILEGASIPVVVELARTSGADVALMGYGLPDDRIHAPNEHFGLNRIKQGFLTIARTLQILGG